MLYKATLYYKYVRGVHKTAQGEAEFWRSVDYWIAIATGNWS